MADRVKINVPVDWDDVVEHSSYSQVDEMIASLVSAHCSYGLDKSLFIQAMDRLIEDVQDRIADPDAKLEIDELVTEQVERFREALHGEY